MNSDSAGGKLITTKLPLLLNRRRAIKTIFGGAAAAWIVNENESAEPQSRRESSVASEALDEAYRILQRQEPKSEQGLSTHAPMVAEALCALGHEEMAVSFVENYRAPVLDLPALVSRIDSKNWRALAEVPLYWKAFGRTPEGRNTLEVLRHVKDLDHFADVRDLVAQPPDLSVAISALTATFSRVYFEFSLCKSKTLQLW